MVKFSADNLTRIPKLQKRAARVILGADPRSNSISLFNKLGWLPFYDEVKVNECLVLKRYKETVPVTCMTFLNAMQIYTPAVGSTVPKTSSTPDTIVNQRERDLLVCPRPGSGTLCPFTLGKEHVYRAIYNHFLTRYNDVDHFI